MARINCYSAINMNVKIQVSAVPRAFKIRKEILGAIIPSSVSRS